MCRLARCRPDMVKVGSPALIELHIRTPAQLFNSLDPSPFHERDLDEEAERYIVGWAREIRGLGPLRLVVTLPSGADTSDTAKHIPDAIHNYFNYRALQAQQEFRELLNIGRQSLAVGVIVLMLCLAGAEYLSLLADQTTIVRLGEQSLIILGWVANWRPLEIFLYEWWPIRRHIVLLRRLAAMPVEVRAASDSAPS